VQAHLKQGISLAPGMEKDCVVKDAKKAGGRTGEDGVGVRYRVLREAAGEGLGRDSVCVYAEQSLRLQIQAHGP
jgi:hypothetical protein